MMTRQNPVRWKAGLVAALLLLAPAWVIAGVQQPPRLVLKITVDALRGDLPGRYAHLFGDCGFRYLMDEGIHYTNAHYQHANTETIVGYVVNSIMGERNDDGSMTVHFGGCEDGRVNCLPIMDGWNYVIRLYQPGPEILDGSWTFPDVEPVN